MESVRNAAMKSFRNLLNRFQSRIKRWSIKLLRNLIWRADEWIHAREEAMRQEARKQECLAEMDAVASSLREQSRRRERVAGRASGEVAGYAASRNRLLRLKYARGEFVRREL